MRIKGQDYLLHCKEMFTAAKKNAFYLLLSLYEKIQTSQSWIKALGGRATLGRVGPKGQYTRRFRLHFTVSIGIRKPIGINGANNHLGYFHLRK